MTMQLLRLTICVLVLSGFVHAQTGLPVPPETVEFQVLPAMGQPWYVAPLFSSGQIPLKAMCDQPPDGYTPLRSNEKAESTEAYALPALGDTHRLVDDEPIYDKPYNWAAKDKDGNADWRNWFGSILTGPVDSTLEFKDPLHPGRICRVALKTANIVQPGDDYRIAAIFYGTTCATAFPAYPECKSTREFAMRVETIPSAPARVVGIGVVQP